MNCNIFNDINKFFICRFLILHYIPPPPLHVIFKEKRSLNQSQNHKAIVGNIILSSDFDLEE